MNEQEIESSNDTKKYFKELNDIAEQFNESRLMGNSILFVNGVAIFLTKANNGIYDSVSEVIGELQDLVEVLPYSAEVSVTGIQFQIKTRDDLPRSIVNDLLDRYVFQGTSIPFGKGEEDFHFTSLFGQTADGHDCNFEEFLKTYPEFLQKKFKHLNKKRRK